MRRRDGISTAARCLVWALEMFRGKLYCMYIVSGLGELLSSAWKLDTEIPKGLTSFAALRFRSKNISSHPPVMEGYNDDYSAEMIERTMISGRSKYLLAIADIDGTRKNTIG
jgi:hypothetical protein